MTELGNFLSAQDLHAVSKKCVDKFKKGRLRNEHY